MQGQRQHTWGGGFARHVHPHAHVAYAPFNLARCWPRPQVRWRFCRPVGTSPGPKRYVFVPSGTTATGTTATGTTATGTTATGTTATGTTATGATATGATATGTTPEPHPDSAWLFFVHKATVPGCPEAYAVLSLSRIENGRHVLNTGTHELRLFSTCPTKPVTIGNFGTVRAEVLGFASLRRRQTRAYYDILGAQMPRSTQHSQTPIPLSQQSSLGLACHIHWHDAEGHTVP
jgi:hypothetical protein